MKPLTDGNNALKIEFDGLEWIETEEVHDYINKKISRNAVLETFKRVDKLPFTNVDIRFSNDVWDFTATATNLLPKGLVFLFTPNSSYCDCLKMFVLNEIIKRRNKIRSIYKKYLLLRKTLELFEEHGYISFELVPKSEFVKFFAELEPTVKYGTVCQYRSTIMTFITFYEQNIAILKDPTIKKYVSEIDTGRYDRARESNKTPEVPPEYLSLLIPAYRRIMLDTSEKNCDRIMAACLLMYSQVGFRTNELLTLEMEPGIEKIEGPAGKEPLRYLVYKSFKHARTDDGYTVGRTFLNDIAYQAFQHLLELGSSRRKELKTNALVVFDTQKQRFYSSSQFSESYRKFVLRHAQKLQCVNIAEQYPDEMKTISVKPFFEKGENGQSQLHFDNPCYEGLSLNDTITYPEIRQFRVSVCCYLYRQQVPLHYIRKHMNHLTADMTAYYIRPEQNAERNYSETIYSAVFKDKAKVLGQHGDVFVEKINAYIEIMEPDIKEDVDAVIAAVAEKYPLRSKVGGFCIRCGNVVPCASNDDTDTIFCAFGMCPNHCHMFFMADISYKAFQDVLVALQYNEEHGYKKAVQKERNKLDYILQNSLVPEITELDRAIERDGAEKIATKYPQLTKIIEKLDAIHEEIEQWA